MSVTRTTDRSAAAVVGERPLAVELAEWAVQLEPSPADLELAQRSLLDTVAVALAARSNPLRPIASLLPEAGNWAAMAHVLDFDDLHLESTAHISAVCVPAVLASGGDARAYLAAAGVMARIGAALGWTHYAQGWHATCTAGAPAAAVAVAMSLGLNVEETARAIALAVPAAGGVQRAFGTSAKALQVGFAADAGERATCLVVAGATADPTALDEWFGLVRGRREQSLPRAPAVPGGLAIKLFPCCYALQRPISAVQRFKVSVEAIQKVILHTPAATLQPLIHHRPATGLESKFSIEYAVAATLLDGSPGFRSFEDPAVSRPEARALLARVQTVASPGGTDLLDGELQVDILLRDGSTVSQRLALPPGAPGVPPTAEQLLAKFSDCGEDIPGLLRDLTWERATEILRRELPSQQASVVGART